MYIVEVERFNIVREFHSHNEMIVYVQSIHRSFPGTEVLVNSVVM